MNFHRLLLALVVATLAATSLAVQSQRPTDPDRVAVGFAGRVLRETKVYHQANTRSQVWFSVQPTTDSLVVEPSAPQGWVKIFLSNGRYGYMPATDIELIRDENGQHHQATVVKKHLTTVRSRPQTQLASRGGGAGRGTAADLGLQFKGTPYKWGGNDIENGIDCSAFVQQLYGAIGLNLPRTAAQQAMVGQPVNRLEDLKKGDRLYFWDYKRNMIGHTGLYLGDGRFVHSSSTRRGVAIDHLGEERWLKILVSARR
jgi:cell wall-associated NlpC family hydrolase